MKKILAIAPYSYLPYYSGGQKFIAKFYEYLSKETDLTVISVAENNARLANYGLLPWLKRSFSRYYDRSLVGKICSLIQQFNYEAIIWEHPYYWWLAKKIKKKTGIRTIIHTHNIEYQRFRSVGKWWWPILRRYERKCLQSADAVFFITPEDQHFALSKWKLDPGKTLLVPFGVEAETSPLDKAIQKKRVCEQHGIDPSKPLLFFNGLLNYKPNLDALNVLLNNVNPLLSARPGFEYTLMICGKGLPEEMNGLKAYSGKHIVYAGFVDDIESYFAAADIFLNPVQSGGGIKTKMVEAIAFGATVVSTQSGAAGMDPSASGKKLEVVKDNDWTSFANAVISIAAEPAQPTPDSFYREYGWKHIIGRVKNFLT